MEKIIARNFSFDNMDYKEKYKQALQRMKDWVDGKYPECPIEPQQIAELVFPELKESPDEKIRKAILFFFETQDEDTTYSFVSRNDIIEWLKNQRHKFKIGDRVHCGDMTQPITITGFSEDAYLTDSAYGVILYADEYNWEVMPSCGCSGKGRWTSSDESMAAKVRRIMLHDGDIFETNDALDWLDSLKNKFNSI